MVNCTRTSTRTYGLRALFALAAVNPAVVTAQQTRRAPTPDTVVVQSGSLALKALLWVPPGKGPFPAVVFNHGNGPSPASTGGNRTTLGSVFATHGYVFLHLFRRGNGLSTNVDTNSFDVITRAFATAGQDGRNREQMRALDGGDYDDVVAGLAFVRRQASVDRNRIAVVGHSFGGSLALVLAERDTGVRAAVVFGAAAGSWAGSAPLRARLTSAVRQTRTPILFATASNDYSTLPATTLAAEMQRLKKAHQLRIYPPFGNTPEVGHDLVYRAVGEWERDVFAFLAAQLPPARR